MSKVLNFFRDIFGEFISERELNYGVRKTVNVLLDLKIADEEIKQMLAKHFNIRYSEAEKALAEAKEENKQ